MYVWDVPSETLQTLLNAHDGRAVTAVAMSVDARTMASAGTDGTVRVWDMRKAPRRQVARMNNDRRSVISDVALSGDGRTLLTGGTGADAYVTRLAAIAQ